MNDYKEFIKSKLTQIKSSGFDRQYFSKKSTFSFALTEKSIDRQYITKNNFAFG